MKRSLVVILFVVALVLFVSSLLVNVESSHSSIVEKMKLLLLQLAVILFCAKLGGEFFAKVLHQPAVLGELLAGVAIGPFALGAFPLPILGGPLFPVPPGALEGTAFPITPELYGIATLASVILLFLAGLETDFKQFMKQSLAGTLVGMGGVAGAFVLGDFLTVWFGFAHHFMDPIALFMGTISVATSVGITARVLSEQKAMDTPEGTTILAGAVIDDVLGILILAVVVGMVGGPHARAPQPYLFSMGTVLEKDLDHGNLTPELRKAFAAKNVKICELAQVTVVKRGNTWEIDDHGYRYHVKKEGASLHISLFSSPHVKTNHGAVSLKSENSVEPKKPKEIDWALIGLIGYKAFAFWIGVTLLVILLAGKIQWLLRSFRNKGTLMALGLGMALLVAGLAEMVGLAAIIGAYAMGLGLSKESVSKELEHALEGLYSVLVPIFFCVMGMLVNIPAMISDPRFITFSLVYSLVAVIAKIIGCGLPTYLVGFNTKGAMRIGIGMLPRGEVALIVAGVGLAGNIINLQLFGVAIAMTLITTLLAPPFLVKLFDGTPGRTKDEAEEKARGEAMKVDPLYKYTLSDVEEGLIYASINSISQAFEEDGFKTDMVAHDPPIYRAIKECLSVEMAQDGHQIHFDMPESKKKEIQVIINKGLDLLEEKVKKLVLKKGEA